MHCAAAQAGSWSCQGTCIIEQCLPEILDGGLQDAARIGRQAQSCTGVHWHRSFLVRQGEGAGTAAACCSFQHPCCSLQSSCQCGAVFFPGGYLITIRIRASAVPGYQGPSEICRYEAVPSHRSCRSVPVVMSLQQRRKASTICKSFGCRIQRCPRILACIF